MEMEDDGDDDPYQNIDSDENRNYADAVGGDAMKKLGLGRESDGGELEGHC